MVLFLAFISTFFISPLTLLAHDQSITFDSAYTTMLNTSTYEHQKPQIKKDQKSSSVSDVKVTLLSDTMTGAYDGNWGFSAFVEITTQSNGTRYILFDSGYKVKTLKIIRDLISKNKIPDFSTFNNGEIDVVLSHWHDDHIEGFRDIKSAFPKWLRRSGRARINFFILGSPQFSQRGKMGDLSVA